MMSRLVPTVLTGLALSSPLAIAQTDGKPAAGPLRTRWAAEVSPANAHAEYPRPQFVRERWANLNGRWHYAIAPRDDARPETWDGEILVPFPVESQLSGVMRRVGPAERLWYRRTFEVPAEWEADHLLLHFGAVDWETEVWVNGTPVGTHRGGYDPFSFDVTQALTGGGPQEILVAVWDPTDAGWQPRGKQVREPRGIWYTPTTGIWRTVWIEPLPTASIERLRLVPSVEDGRIYLSLVARGIGNEHLIESIATDGEGVYVREIVEPPEREEPGPFVEDWHLELPDARPWSPDDPFLYDLTVRVKKGDEVVDEVRSYFGLRQIDLRRDEEGIPRLFLNDRPLFQYGPLDQGFWPDGLYTAPTDEALRHDLEVTKRLGFNMVRKHVKIEPARWYYWCDRLGLLVWQDMPSGDRYIGAHAPDIERSPASAANFERELHDNIEALFNHPSIVMWVPYNEGWGQWDTERIVRLIAEQDPTRLVDDTSGWADRGVGDVRDIHAYPGPALPPLEERRAAVLGEFGGLGLPLPGHTWRDEKNWGYRNYGTRAALTDAYVALLGNLRPLIARGLAAAVYTQITDVEIEVNGLMTYDRSLIKVDAARAAAAARELHLPPPVVTPVIPTSQEQGQVWRFTTSDPGDGWRREDFDDSAWKSGPGGFGTEGTPGAVVRTTWDSPDIWLRRTVELTDDVDPAHLRLSIHHDEEVAVFWDGVRILRRSGYSTFYVLATPSVETRSLFTPGSHTLAVHCHQSAGGQYVDLGLVDVREAGE